jgi:hypothetical protein
VQTTHLVLSPSSVGMEEAEVKPRKNRENLNEKKNF